ncbi:ABC transporter substrate-binding protein [Micromonospora sp. NPDC005806]|uniref:ABC transporter substrate-binding protein n=1 Tax=Micromonospora sp. NPDC005806 TaxID=3364234 RepID=UPI00369D9B50
MELVVGSFTPSVLLAVARRTGRLEEQSLEVTEVAVPSSPAQFRSLIAGEIDVALTSPDNVVAYRFSPENPLGVMADARIVSAVDRGLGLGLYGRPGLAPEQLRAARVGVDVPTSGFALAMYALAESLGVGRDEYELLTLGSTPRRLDALLAGECDATMLNAGNELLAEAAGAVTLARVGDVCSPYLGTVVSVVGERFLEPARRFGDALRETARDICHGTAETAAAEEAASVLGLAGDLARRYVARLQSTSEGLVLDTAVDLAALTTVVDLRRRYLPTWRDGRDVLAGALAPESGLTSYASSEA